MIAVGTTRYAQSYPQVLWIKNGISIQQIIGGYREMLSKRAVTAPLIYFSRGRVRMSTNLRSHWSFLAKMPVPREICFVTSRFNPAEEMVKCSRLG